MKELNHLQIALGYNFTDTKLLELALSHRSVGSKNNERLEFLGDSLINYVIAEVVFHRFPLLNEGELSRVRSNLVRSETLADLGMDLDISEHLILGIGERKSGGRHRRSVIADSVEALAGAILLDGGFEEARKAILSWYSKQFAQLSEDLAQKDPKTQIQEYAQARGLGLPIYEVDSIEGEPHELQYFVTCRIGADISVGRGSGSSRQAAEQQAAARVLADL